MANRINITNIDFEGIKTALKTYLASQPEYTDFDFEGSGWSQILDVLAYNTHFNAYYLNLVANEAFLSTAQIRDSVVDKAKELGYVPQSRRAPVATVDLVATPGVDSIAYDSLASINMDAGTVFTTNVDGKAYEFTNIVNHTLFKDIDGSFKLAGVELHEGTLLSYRWLHSTSNPVRFTIPNEKIDTTTIKVTVQRSQLDDTITVFKPASDFSDLKGDNEAYWIYEVEKEYYELEFGDGILGKSLEDGNIVRVEYISTNATEANKAKEFVSVGSIQGLANITVTTDTAAYGGAEKESIESIKFNAIRQFSSQNRAVTKEDYESILRREFPFIESVSVWGGEDNDPPQFGKVFISIKPFEGLTLTAQVKEDIKNDILARYNIVAVLPEIVDPDFIFLNLDVAAEYNALKTTKSVSDIQADLINEVAVYESEFLGKFQKSFIHSDLVCILRDSDSSITSILINITIEKRPEVNIGVVGNYSFTFSNAVQAGSFVASGFQLFEAIPVANATYEIRDDSEGNLIAYRITASNEVSLGAAGDIDYLTGFVNIQQVNITSVDEVIDQTITAKALPVELDVDSATNKIIVIEPEAVDIIVSADD